MGRLNSAINAILVSFVIGLCVGAFAGGVALMYKVIVRLV